MEYVDKLAEESVREAIEALAAAGKRAYSKNVPAKAKKLLLKKGRGRITVAHAEQLVLDASWRLKERKEIIAPTSPHIDWVIVDRIAPAEEASQAN